MSQKPNILYIICHDLGRHLSCLGRQPINTPNLDRLAEEGALFLNHFCTAPSCSPSRGSIMTGRYPHSNGLMGLVGLGWSLPETEKTLPQYLQDRGYQTALCGLQHEREGDASSLGYDEIIAPKLPANRIADAAIDYLNQTTSAPFLLSVSLVEPHRPFFAETVGEDDPAFQPPYLPANDIVRKQMAGFAGRVSQMDESVGRICRHLDELGLSERTLVVFTTDHGIDMPRAKGTLYDPGIETALIMRHPGVIPEGIRSDELLSNVDILPTMLDACDIEGNSSVQGKSFWPYLQDQPYESRDKVFAEKTHHTWYDPMRCIRTAAHKYIHNFGTLRHIEIPADIEMDCLTAVPELCRNRRPVVELYDLENDPLEQHNLAGKAEHAQLESSLRSQLRQWMEETGDPLLNGVMPIPKFL